MTEKPKSNAHQEKQERLARALRDNLRKRKQQQRRREEDTSAPNL